MSRIASICLVALLVACASAPRAPTPNVAAVSTVDAGAEEEETADDAGAAEPEAAPTEVAEEPPGPCPPEMVLVEGDGVRVCVDRWEASLVEIDSDGSEKPYPHWLPVDGHTVRAVSQPDAFPQGYISEVQAEDACAASKKRLCLENEWMTACAGPEKTTYPYGEGRKPTACNDSGRSAVGAVFGMQALASSAPPSGKPAHVTMRKAAVTTRTKPSKKGAKAAKATSSKKKKGKPAAAKASRKPADVSESVWTKLNDPRLGQVDGALAKTGTHEECTNSYGAFDMMGNLHEWVRTPPSEPHGTFCGGYFLDTTLNGDGCKYRTKAHAHDYHDYSTGFRCCADPR